MSRFLSAEQEGRAYERVFDGQRMATSNAATDTPEIVNGRVI